ncbi:GNAT family N-acetyltransferase [Streptomyces sp. NPDC002521]
MTAAWDVTVHRDLAEADLDTDRWDALFGARSFYSATPWLRHAQATAATAPYYFTAAQDDGEPSAALPAYPLDATTPYVFCSPGRVTAAIHERLTGKAADWPAALMPALACGGRNPSHTKAGVSTDLPPQQQREALHELVAAAEHTAWQADLEAVSFLYVDEDDTLLRQVLTSRQYTALPGQTAYSLEVPADGRFDTYLARFPSRHRVKIRKEVRVLAEAGVTYCTQPLTDELIEQIAPLETALYAKHGTPADPGAFLAVLRSVATNAEPAARVTTAHLDGELAGFVLTFTHGGQLYARQGGLDYAAKGRLPLYFGLVYYELLRLAMAEGLTHIHYSTGSDEVKMSRGCTPVCQFAYVKARREHVASRLAELGAREPHRGSA